MKASYKLTNTIDGGAHDHRFGYEVAVDGDTVVVGSPGSGSSYVDEEHVVYVYVHSGDGWEQQAQLVSPDREQKSSYFGGSVAIDGNTIVVGDPSKLVDGRVNQGAAYVFTRIDTTWSLQQRLTAADGRSNDFFGSDVFVDGDTIIIGAPFFQDENLRKGSAYVFARNGGTWSIQAKLVAGDGIPGDGFGEAVAVKNNTAIVGSRRNAVYLFKRDEAKWVQEQKLASEIASSFGNAIALNPDTVIIGAPGRGSADVSGPGSVYIYTRNNTDWTLQEQLLASDGKPGDGFGNAVSIHEDTVLVSASSTDIDDMENHGAAYVYTRNGSTWHQQQTLVAVLEPHSVALDKNTALVGAPFFSQHGRVYFYELCNTIDFPPPPDGAVGDVITLEATATSGLPVAYEAGPFSVCVVIGDTLNLRGPGTCRITASQPGNSVHPPADDVTVTITVHKGQNIEWPDPDKYHPAELDMQRVEEDEEKDSL